MNSDIFIMLLEISSSITSPMLTIKALGSGTTGIQASSFLIWRPISFEVKWYGRPDKSDCRAQSPALVGNMEDSNSSSWIASLLQKAFSYLQSSFLMLLPIGSESSRQQILNLSTTPLEFLYMA
ncbi:hypothetical protein ACH5RR_015450 [Cinchona calisaya]|uniref:Uncharacterized protein n=1 Tax=Cinchona calisaya TaxID=153742 RepID=A0ABD2ZT54_9GENT